MDVPDGPPGRGSRFGFALRRPVLAAALVAAVLYLPWLAAAPVRGALEANRLVASREMFARGDRVLPTLNGAAESAGGPQWAELDRFDLGSRRLHLIRREPASSRREP